ncbi:MAG: glycosyltransferase [Hyphomicrobiales bacterium]|nr:glycosyltransferase [Hyphomicrobiales bacterium]
MKKTVLGLKPISATGNSFAGLFSRHIDDASFEREAFEWDKLGGGRYDIVVFHWPTEFFRPTSRKASLALLAGMLRARLLHRTKFVWVVHNLEPHDGGSMKSEVTTRLFLRLLNGVILISRHSLGELHRYYPQTRSLPALITRHGRYEPLASPPAAFMPATRRNRLLFFGMIREYKNVERLVAEARKVELAPFSLTVTGVCRDEGLERRIRQAAGDDMRIDLDIRHSFVPDEELERVIDAHDAVVLPYRNILNSGVALHALGRNKPILAPRIGSLPELQQEAGKEWVHLFDGEITADHMTRFLAALDFTGPVPDLSAYEWQRVGNEVTGFLQTLK